MIYRIHRPSAGIPLEALVKPVGRSIGYITCCNYPAKSDLVPKLISLGHLPEQSVKDGVKFTVAKRMSAYGVIFYIFMLNARIIFELWEVESPRSLGVPPAAVQFPSYSFTFTPQRNAFFTTQRNIRIV